MLKYHADHFGPRAPEIGTIISMPRTLPRPLTTGVDAPARHGRFEVIAYPVCGGYLPTHPGNRPMAHCAIIRRLCDGFTTTIATHYLTRILEAD
jgi:hypothetical protein